MILHEATAISWFRLTSISPDNNLEPVKNVRNQTFLYNNHLVFFKKKKKRKNNYIGLQLRLENLNRNRHDDDNVKRSNQSHGSSHPSYDQSPSSYHGDSGNTGGPPLSTWTRGTNPPPFGGPWDYSSRIQL